MNWHIKHFNKLDIMTNLDLVFRNLAEVIGRETLSAKVANGENLTAYIGFAPTGKIHLGYLMPCVKIRDLTLAGCNVAVMIADIHCIMDARKTPSHLVSIRSEYYQETLQFILKKVGADMSRIKFVLGSEFQLTPQYAMDILEIASHTTVAAARHAGSEVVKQNKDPNVGSLLYPIMQAVDENYVGQMTFGQQADIELGGLDQRKIFCFAKSCGSTTSTTSSVAYLMNPVISLSQKGKMSASDMRAKIELSDADDEIARKIKAAFCVDGDPNCGLMTIMKCVFFPITTSPIQVLADNDTSLSFDTYSELEQGFITGAFVARHLKQCLTRLICDLFVDIRNHQLSDAIVALTSQAYPEA